jgi:hypothetical protein
VEEDTPQIPPSEATARFYFQLTYLLGNENLTQYERVNDLNMYLCLNTASLIKERRLKEQEEIRKIQQKKGDIFELEDHEKDELRELMKSKKGSDNVDI